MKLKQILASVLSGACLIGVTACGGTVQAPASETTAEVGETAEVSATEGDTSAQAGTSIDSSDIGLLNAGQFTVGMEIGYPPFEAMGQDGVTPVGLDVDLGAAIAEEFGATVSYIDTAWDGIFEGLATDKYDVVISAATITPERKETMDFSAPYIENWQSIVIKKGNTAHEIKTPEDLGGLKVGYQQSTTSEKYLQDLIDTDKLKCDQLSYDKILNAFSDLKNGQSDAVICDSTVAEGYVSREPEEYEIVWHQQDEPGAEAEIFGVAVKKGNTKLLNAVDTALANLEASGKLDEIRDEWLK